MDETELKNLIEALLMSSDKPLLMEQFLSVFDEWQVPERRAILNALEQLAEEYQGRSIELRQLASGWSIQTKEKYGVWISRLQTEKPGKYSRALLETLAIIAYRQPVTRADIEDIRGVAVSSSILKTLMEREWVKVAGHRDLPGKPAVYITTKRFLDYFNLASIEQLPALPPGPDETASMVEPFIEECVN